MRNADLNIVPMGSGIPEVMFAMRLERTGVLTPDAMPLEPVEIPVPGPGDGEVLLRVDACGVCHTELDEIEGRTAPPTLPVTPGHEVVGEIIAIGEGVAGDRLGRRVGVGWIHHGSGGEWENLEPDFCATGRDVDGGYAQYMVAKDRYAFDIPDRFSDVAAAPLLCAGGVGYRALRLCQVSDGGRLGLTGFGGSAHLVAQLVRALQPTTSIYVFARDPQQRKFALELGAEWAGDTADRAPVPLDAIIDTTPAWTPVLEALTNLRPGGRLVINAIRKEAGDQDALTRMNYEKHLWMEREIKTVANVTGQDLAEFLPLADEAGLSPTVRVWPLREANEALRELRFGPIRGAHVLVPNSGDVAP